MSRKHNRNEEEEEESYEEHNSEGKRTGRKIVLIKKISPSKALFRRVIIKPAKSGEPIKETLIKIEAKKPKEEDKDESTKNTETQKNVKKSTEKEEKLATHDKKKVRTFIWYF